MEWVQIFKNKKEASEFLGSKPRLKIIEGKSICMVWFDGRILASEDRCPHKGESLSKGNVNSLGEIICPWHEYRFNMTTGRECSHRCVDLDTYPVKETAEGIFIAL